jgi:5-methylcytosine-specific restriction protein A
MEENRNPWWVQQDRNKRLNEKTKSEHRQKHQKFYQSKEWQRLRLLKLGIDPLCEECLLQSMCCPGQHIDHIVSLQDDWNKRYHLQNLRTLCISHHSIKTKQEQVERKNKNLEDRMKDLNTFA